MKQKQKAETLPEAQFERWKPEYNKIVDKIIKIEKELKIPYDEKKEDELIEYMTLFAPGNLERHEIDYLNKNPELDKRYGMQFYEIERVYNEKQSITELEKEIKKLVEIWKEIIEKAKG